MIIKKKELLLGRDHVGMKPLYYSATSQNFVFGSEPKVLFKSNLVPKKVSERAFFEYFCRGAPPYLETIYQNVFEVEPGTCLKINTKKGKIQKQETHRLKLYKKEELESLLIGAGFSPTFVRGYGSYNFPFHKGYGGFIARKK